MTTELLDEHEVAAALKMTPRWVLAAAGRGDIPYVRVSRWFRFTPEQVEQMIDHHLSARFTR
jgi:hypothetical protein